MTHALVTIIAPLDLAQVPEAEQRITALGNPARQDVEDALDRLDGSEGTHFASLHAIRSKTPGKAYLAFEFSADGTEEAAIERIAHAIGVPLQTVFSLASDWKDGTEIGAYLLAHRMTTGVGLSGNPGLGFAGTPGITVGRIRSEAALARRITTLLGAPDQERDDLWSLERVEMLRNHLRDDPQFADLLETGEPAPPFQPADTVSLVGQMILSFLATYLWPVGIVLLLLAAVGGVCGAWYAHGFWPVIGAFLGGFLKSLIVGSFIAIIVLLLALIVAYAELRSLEDRDSVEERTADAATLAAIFERENRYTQNHMVSVTQRKPGGIRWFTARLVFWVIGQLATLLYKPGFLSDIGTIHFARWVTPPGTRDLLFFSNYDSSWESYLEDFITRAHLGLTGVWSNSIGFPRSENLFQGGATDGERFKRYARQSMIPTLFWYSAYPKLSTAEIRTNAAIRRGIAGVQTEDEADSFLALFGSAARPPSKLISSEIQSIVFGGLGFMYHGICLFYDVPPVLKEARAWLKGVSGKVAFNDGRRLTGKAVVTLALGPEGLRRLGLPEEGLRTFPYAFLTGMTTESRARILGDTGINAWDHWRWGRVTPQAALILYGYEQADVETLEDQLAALSQTHGATLVHRVPLKTINPDDKREPFGFADGGSQPVIRGTYKGMRSADPIHLVEPGEFILGYPDNRDNVPPGPTLPATADPANILPLVATAGDFSRNFVDGVRDLGRNGSFLVIRELEQDTDAFDAYCKSEAARLQGRLPEPYRVTDEFIGAKLIGRWHDGSSLVRHPYLSRTEDRRDGRMERPIPSAAAMAASSAPVARPSAASTAPSQPGETRPRPSYREDNDFLFGTEDPEALRCPYGAHIRRANPRDSQDPGSAEQIAISNRHRILRIGRQYEPRNGGKKGLFFMCLNGDIERQFEFVQQTWLKSPSFHGLSCEKDPVLGDGEEGMCGFTIPTRYGPVRLSQMPPFVATKGGGYFFLPSRRLIEFLANAP